MLVAVGLLIAFVIVVMYERQNKLTRKCRWRADRTGDEGDLHKYRCAACGAEVFTTTNGPPRECKSNISRS